MDDDGGVGAGGRPNRLSDLRRRRQERHLADDELVARALACPPGLPCPEWERLKEELAEYGYGKLVAWAVRGTLRQKAATAGTKRRPVLGLGRVPERLDLSEADARSLVTEMVTMAIRTFRHQSLPRWSPAGGRSLASYFVTWCLMKLPDAYERWTRYEAEEWALLAFEGVDRPDGDPGPEDVSDLLDDLRSLAAGDPVTLRILWLRVEGCTYPEIVETLMEEGTLMTQAQVRRRLKSLAGRAREQRDRRHDQ